MKQLELEEENKDKNGIINTLTNIGLSYFYDDEYEKALEYFEKSITENGIENLFHTVETLTFKHICEFILDLPIKDISGKTTLGYCLGCVALNKKLVCFLK